jgi:hypothetical protein
MELSSSLRQFTQAFGSCLSTQLFEGRINFTDFEHLFSKINIYEKTRGQLETIRVLKETRVAVYNFVAGRKVYTNGISTYHDGIPKILGPLVSKGLRSHDPLYIRAVLTALLYSRVIDAWKEPDTTTITKGPSYTSLIREEYKRDIPVIVGRLIPNRPNLPIWTNPHYTTKASPQGLAMHTLKDELLQISTDPKLYGAIKTLGGEALVMYMELHINEPDRIKLAGKPKKSREGRLRSIGVVRDTEGKSRVIAMADYWTQTTLKPLHDTLLGVLAKIKSDLTFGQDIKPFGEPGQFYWSFDLTAATDRLPIFLYEDILVELFGSEYQESWTYLMKEIPFHWKNSTITYNTGQPMGLYSSWALLALAHHAIVQYSAHKIGLREFWDYRILGDDIVIRNDEVAHAYAETIKSLGVEISPTKTLVSRDTFEFAKRLFTKGQEVTGFPLNGWMSACNNKWIDQLNIVETAIRRGFAQSQLVNIETLTKLQEFTGKDYNLRYKLSRNILTHMAVTGTNTELLVKVGRLWNHKLTCVTSPTSFRSYIYSEFGDLVQKLFIKTMEDTCRMIRKSLPDNLKVQSITNVRQMTWEVPDRVYALSKKVQEPLVQALSASLHRSMQNFNDVEDKYSFMGRFPTLEKFIDFIREVDLRVPNLLIRDSSRKSERALSVTASLTVKSMTLSR